MPFLSLPALPLSLILQHLNVHEILTLSSCSRRAKKLVGSAKTKANRLTWKITDKNLEVFILLEFSDKESVLFYGTKIRDPLALPKVNLDTLMVFSGVRTYVTESRPNCYWTIISPFTRAFMIKGDYQLDHITEHLLEVFSFRKLDLHMKCADNVMKSFVWKYADKKGFNEVHIGPDFYNLAMAPKMDSEDFNQLLENVKIEELELNIEAMDLNFKFSNPLKPKKITIHEDTWLDFQAILTSKSTVIQLKRIFRPKPSNLNNLLSRWSEGLLNLKTFSVTWEKRSQPEKELVFKGIEVKEVETTYHFPEHSKMSFGIVRSDGETAKVVMTARSFLFYTDIDN